jgi:hypothetical protein
MTPPQRRLKTEETIAALDALPGVKSSAAAMKLPLRGGGDSFNVQVEGRAGDEQIFSY